MISIKSFPQKIFTLLSITIGITFISCMSSLNPFAGDGDNPGGQDPQNNSDTINIVGSWVIDSLWTKVNGSSGEQESDTVIYNKETASIDNFVGYTLSFSKNGTKVTTSKSGINGETGTYTMSGSYLYFTSFKYTIEEKLSLSGSILEMSGTWTPIAGVMIEQRYWLHKVKTIIQVTGVSLKSKTQIEVGKTEQLDAIIKPDSATFKTVTWSTSDSAVAKVSSTGLVTGISAGTTVVTATTNNGNYKAKCEVSVVTTVTGITIESSITVNIGDIVQIPITILPNNATDKTVNWTSADSTVVKVSSTGFVTGIAEGKSVITVKTNDGNFTAQCIVSVSNKNIYANFGQIALVKPNPDFWLGPVYIYRNSSSSEYAYWNMAVVNIGNSPCSLIKLSGINFKNSAGTVIGTSTGTYVNGRVMNVMSSFTNTCLLPGDTGYITGIQAGIFSQVALFEADSIDGENFSMTRPLANVLQTNSTKIGSGINIDVHNSGIATAVLKLCPALFFDFSGFPVGWAYVNPKAPLIAPNANNSYIDTNVYTEKTWTSAKLCVDFQDTTIVAPQILAKQTITNPIKLFTEEDVFRMVNERNLREERKRERLIME